MARSYVRLGLLLVALAGIAAWAQPVAAARPRVGVLTDNYPFSYRDTDGRMQGFSYELVEEIERVMQLDFERVPGLTNEVNGAFAAGRVDLVQSYVRFPARDAHADFSVPYLTMTGTIFVRADEERVATLADLKGRRVLVHRDSMGEDVLRRAGLADTIVYTPSVEQSLLALERGEGDAVLVSRLNGLMLVQRLNLRHVKPLPAPVQDYEVAYCIAVRKGQARLLAQINEGLAILTRTGKFDALYQKWFGRIEPKGYTAEQVIGVIAVGLALALAIAIWAAANQRRLRGRLAQQAEALRVNEERYRGVFEGSRDGLIVVTRVDGALRVEQANPAALRLLGRTQAPEPGRLLSDLLAGEPDLLARVQGAAGGDHLEEYELARAGGQAWLRASVCPLGERLLLTLADITEAVRVRNRLQQQEEQLRQKQKLEAIGTLAGGVAHDFNNLLTAILGNVDLSLRGLPRDHPEAPGLRLALQAARRARDLVQQILAFSRQTASRREVVVVGPLVQETIHLLRSLAKGGVVFETDIPADLPPILADPAQVHQVLMNLGTNAVQALRGRTGRVLFQAEPVEAGPDLIAQHPELRAGFYVRVSLQDDGPGMSPEVQSRAFEPFFTTKPPGEGTGLGLSVVHGIMQQHGGAVALYSHPGRGTRFSLYFPRAARPTGGTASPLPASRPAGNGERVLFVDDDPAVLQTAPKMLERLGYAVTAVSRGEEAWAEFRAQPEEFALVISDLTMPGMNGLQLLQRIHGLRPQQPTLLTSGFFSESERSAAAACGVAGLLPKPLDLDALGRAADTALGRGSDGVTPPGSGSAPLLPA